MRGPLESGGPDKGDNVENGISYRLVPNYRIAWLKVLFWFAKFRLRELCLFAISFHLQDNNKDLVINCLFLKPNYFLEMIN